MLTTVVRKHILIGTQISQCHSHMGLILSASVSAVMVLRVLHAAGTSSNILIANEHDCTFAKAHKNIPSQP